MPSDPRDRFLRDSILYENNQSRPAYVSTGPRAKLDLGVLVLLKILIICTPTTVLKAFRNRVRREAQTARGVGVGVRFHNSSSDKGGDPEYHLGRLFSPRSVTYCCKPDYVDCSNPQRVLSSAFASEKTTTYPIRSYLAQPFSPPPPSPTFHHCRALVDMLRHQSSPVQQDERNNSVALTMADDQGTLGRPPKNLYAPGLPSKDNRCE